MGIRISTRSLAWGILLAALLARLAAVGWWETRLPPGESFIFPDSESYWALGQSIAHREPYAFGAHEARIFRAPGYPLLLAGIFAIGGEETPPAAARVLGAMLGVGSVALVMLLARLLFDPVTALVAGTIAAVYPGAIAMSTVVLSEAAFMPLMLLQISLWILALRREQRKTFLALALAAGVVAGLATLVRPSWLLFTPLAIVVAVVCCRQRGRQLLLGAVMLLGLMLTMLPWWVRNYNLAGRFVPTTLTVGASLYDGLNPNATGASNMSFMPAFEAEQQRQEMVVDIPLARLPEDRLDTNLRDSALTWARQNPRRVAELAMIKLGRMWNIWPNEAAFRSLPARLIVAATYLPLMVLALLGAWRFAPRGWPYVLCLLPAVYFSLLHIVFVGSIRYRQPALLTLMVLAGGIIACWIGHKHAAATCSNDPAAPAVPPAS